MFCTTCAAPNPLTASVCAACGSALPGIARGRAPAAAPGARQAIRSPRRLAQVAVALLPVVALLAGVLAVVAVNHTARADRAGAYERGAQAVAGGDYLTAIEAFGDAGDFRDAPDRHAAARQALEPYRVAYVDGAAALADGRFEEAIAALLPVARDLPGYESAAVLLEQARNARAIELTQEAAAAETRREWLAADRALSDLAALDPTDATVTDQLAALRREHGPMVLTRGGELYVTGPDGAEERLVTADVTAAWPVWSPDRERIAFISREPVDGVYDGTLYVVNADGTGLRELASRVLGRGNWPVWSPDGTYIAFTSFTAFDDVAEEGVISIHMVDVATGEETDLTGSHREHAGSVTWSPEGDRIAFVSYRVSHPSVGGVEFRDGDVFMLDLTTDALTNVTRGRVFEERRVAWSPVDDRLLIFTDPGDWTDPEQSEILILDLPADRLTSIETRTWEVGVPVWSPDGGKLAYLEGDDVVRVLSGDGDQRIKLATPVSPYLSWSPDGGAIFAPAVDGRNQSYILSLDPAPERARRQTVEIAYDASRDLAGPPVWSPRNMITPRPPATVAGAGLDPGPESVRAIVVPNPTGPPEPGINE